MQMKEGVDNADVHPVLWLFLGAIAVHYADVAGEPMVITSLRRPPGPRPSRHSPPLGVSCTAADFRRWGLDKKGLTETFARELQRMWGDQLGVVVEPDWLTPNQIAERGGVGKIAGHIHVELKSTAWPAGL